MKKYNDKFKLEKLINTSIDVNRGLKLMEIRESMSNLRASGGLQEGNITGTSPDLDSIPTLGTTPAPARDPDPSPDINRVAYQGSGPVPSRGRDPSRNWLDLRTKTSVSPKC